MKSLKFGFVAVTVVTAVFYVSFMSAAQTYGSSPDKISTSPGTGSKPCTVKANPNPAFLGAYSCIVSGTSSSGRHFSNPVSYRLEQTGNGYSFYYDFKPEKGAGLAGHQSATLNGDQISFVAPSGRTIRFIARGEKVYFVSPTGEGEFLMHRKETSR